MADSELERYIAQYNEIAELAGSFAHEIKNPLSTILLSMELLAEDLAEPETPRERRALAKVEVVRGQCRRLEAMANDFLRFARLRQLDLSPGDLNEIIGRVLDFFALAAREQGVEISRYLDPNLPSILLHPETMYAALLNLVKNALEAMPNGGHLTARTRATRDGVALDLIDSGCGMDQKTALHMFDAFFSTKDGGTGLGLPTARKVIDAHRGTIEVQSEVGRGTKFTLAFPTPRRLG